MKRCPACSAVCMESHRHCPACGADVTRAPLLDGDPFIGTTLAGKYHLTELIGEGAMGKVYRADHLALDAQVAVKVLNSEVANDPQTAKRFQHEARAASRLRHPNTIAVIDSGQSESGALYIVMELLRGRSLGRVLKTESPLSPMRIAELLGQALMALDEAHAAGIVHRDFKPDNVMVETLRTGVEHVKVLDFGIAKLRGQADANLTTRGTVCGTPDYMSPEQVRGEELDARSDLYAVGVVLYEMLCGEKPFRSNRPVIEVLSAHLTEQVVPPSTRKPALNVPRPLEDLTMRLLSKNRDHRPRSAGEVQKLLDGAVREISGKRCSQCSAPLPRTARFCSQCGAVLGSVAGLVSPGLVLTTHAPSAPAVAPTAVDFAPPEKKTEPIKLPLPFVGRDAVLERLLKLEHGSLFLVGEAGMGKTRVIDELEQRLRASGKAIAIARPDPSGAAVPLHPLRDLLTKLLNLTERPTFDELDEAIASHKEDRVGLAELFGLGGAASQLPLDVRRRETRRAMLATLRGRRATLVFEDLGLYDKPSREIVRALIADAGDAAIVVTGNQADVLDADVEVVRLAALAPDAIAKLQLPHGVIDGAFGVPFAVDEAVRAHLEGISGQTAERLATLNPEARDLLFALCTSGLDVQSAALKEICPLEDGGRSLAELRNRGFVRLVEGHVAVASPTLRRRVEAQIAIERASELHARAAKALGTRAADPLVVAHHTWRAGEHRALAVFEAAGDAARVDFDDDAAVRWYSAARDASEDKKARLRLGLKLAPALRYQGDVLGSEAVLKDALRLATDTQDRWSEVQLRRGLARLATSWQDDAAARTQLVDAVGPALAIGEVSLLADVYFELGEVLQRLGDKDVAKRELWEGIMLCTAGEGPGAKSGPDSLWRMLLVLGEIELSQGALVTAQDHGQAALKQAQRVQSALARARANAFLSRVADAGGRSDESAQFRKAAADDLRRAGDRTALEQLG